MTLTSNSTRPPGQHSGELSRRGFLRNLAAGAGACGGLGLIDFMSLSADELRRRGMSCILLWMQGGPSQLETFDPKPEHENGGPTKAISTNVSGLRIAEHWPRVAHVMDEIAVIRSMTNREGNHQRATYQLHTGNIPAGGVKHPSLGSAVVSETASETRSGGGKGALPPFVAVGQGGQANGLGAGFLGVEYDPFVVRRAGTLPDNVSLGVSEDRFSRRLGLLTRLEGELSRGGAAKQVDDHQALYRKAAGLATSANLKAFDFEDEPESMRDAYGRDNFGQGCLLARRLIEAGVTFVEVRSGGWDTHQDNFERVKTLAADVDQGFAQLIKDLRQRGRLDKTLVIWMGEFGRTPKINARTGRDHFPRAFNVALAGGGVQGGQAIGSTSADGTEVRDRPVTVPDLFCSIFKGLGIDPRTENESVLGRPIKLVEGGEAVPELFG